MNYTGTIIEESLKDKKVLEMVKVLSTRVSKVTEKHKTPWVKQWTLHVVEIREDRVDEIADLISNSLDTKHAWYADFKNDKIHYIIFLNKIFRADLQNPNYKEAANYGISLGIPEYQLDFVGVE